MGVKELPGENVYKGSIKTALFTGDQITYEIDINGQKIMATLGPHEHYEVNEQVFVQLNTERCRPMRRTDDPLAGSADLEAAGRD